MAIIPLMMMVITRDSGRHPRGSIAFTRDSIGRYINLAVKNRDAIGMHRDHISRSRCTFRRYSDLVPALSDAIASARHTNGKHSEAKEKRL